MKIKIEIRSDKAREENEYKDRVVIEIDGEVMWMYTMESQRIMT